MKSHKMEDNREKKYEIFISNDAFAMDVNVREGAREKIVL